MSLSSRHYEDSLGDRPRKRPHRTGGRHELSGLGKSSAGEQKLRPVKCNPVTKFCFISTILPRSPVKRRTRPSQARDQARSRGEKSNEEGAHGFCLWLLADEGEPGN